jgi:hypothetical protein
VRLTGSAPTADQRFDGASADLSTVVISTTQQLLAGDTDTLFDVYAVDAAHTVTRVSSMGNATGCNVANTAGAAFTKLNNCEARTVAVSSDGSSIAFVSGETAAGAASNAPHLYVRRGNVLTEVATLSNVSDLVPPRGAQLSADGSTLVLATAAALVAEDTDAAVDVYRWTASGLQLLSGDGSSDAVLSSSAPAYSLSSHLDAPPRNVTDDGACAFFETADALVAGDTNGKVDVYASCDGVPALVSGGAGPDDSHFVGSTGDGQDVFFVTTDALSVIDVDGGASLYDWRLDGHVATGPPAGCDEDACQGAPSAQIDRPSGLTAGEGEGGPDAGTGLFTLTAVQATAAKAARRGFFRVQAIPPGAGAIRVTATARVKRKRVVIASAKRTVAKADPVGLRLKLSRAARRALRHRALKVHVVGRFVAPGIDTSDEDDVKLDRAPRPHKRKRGRAGR